MLEQACERTGRFQRRLAEEGIDVAILTDEAARVQQAAIDAQQAALAAICPGVTAESVVAAANEVYRARGYETGYRTGRSIGVSYLEAPELKAGG